MWNLSIVVILMSLTVGVYVQYTLALYTHSSDDHYLAHSIVKPVYCGLPISRPSSIIQPG